MLKSILNLFLILLYSKSSLAVKQVRSVLPTSIRSLTILDPDPNMTGPIYRVYSIYYYEGGTRLEYDIVSKYNDLVFRKKLDYLSLDGPKKAMDLYTKRSAESSYFCCEHSNIKLKGNDITFNVIIDKTNFICYVKEANKKSSSLICNEATL